MVFYLFLLLFWSFVMFFFIICEFSCYNTSLLGSYLSLYMFSFLSAILLHVFMLLVVFWLFKANCVLEKNFFQWRRFLLFIILLIVLFWLFSLPLYLTIRAFFG